MWLYPRTLHTGHLSSLLVETVSQTCLVSCWESTAEQGTDPNRPNTSSSMFNMFHICPSRLLLRTSDCPGVFTTVTALPFFHFLSIHRSCRISRGPHQSACNYYKHSLGYQGRSLHFSVLLKAFLLEVSGIASQKKQHMEEMFTVPCTNQEETWD